ncbi:unnamed protein product [Schistosoma mattheei]|uniref:Uncharacterized protein n=1 Tax=Schistosoma mattheei TaxID=31246 RepID=A0A3P8BR45_9TREM|nr:unnamed protein product [Schistosoma mattheei]
MFLYYQKSTFYHQMHKFYFIVYLRMVFINVVYFLIN